MPKYQVRIPEGIRPYPEQHEITAADILVRHFKADVKFIVRNCYHKSADIIVNGVRWELKSPTGKGKHNIQHQLQDASKQSPNVVLDSRRSKIHQYRINREAERQFRIIARSKRLLVITKSGKILEFSK